jgi:hypothetical protein
MSLQAQVCQAQPYLGYEPLHAYNGRLDTPHAHVTHVCFDPRVVGATDADAWCAWRGTGQGVRLGCIMAPFLPAFMV